MKIFVEEIENCMWFWNVCPLYFFMTAEVKSISGCAEINVNQYGILLKVTESESETVEL